MRYQETIQNIANNLVIDFREVWHSAEIITIDNVRKPMVSDGTEWVDLSPTDEGETIYIRRSGDDEVVERLKIGSCTNDYAMRTAMRLVYFRDNAGDSGRVLWSLMQSVLVGSVRLRSIITDKSKLLKDESSGAYQPGPRTIYIGIDFYVMWDLIRSECEQDFCELIPNPLCTVESGV